MPNLGGSELIIVLLIVVVLFGVGRISRIGGELGSAIANFRRGLEDGQKDKSQEETSSEAKS